MTSRLPLGNCGLEISPIGLGTVKLGRDQGVKYPEKFVIPDQHAAESLLNHARELGINLIDTAPAYGTSEERLGPILEKQRRDWIICTKVGEEFIYGKSFYDFSAEHTRKSIERSLLRLRTDYLDIVLIHSDGNDLDIIRRFGTLDVLADLKKQGLIKAVGMSTKTVAGGIEALKRSDIAMVTYNLSHQEEREVIDFAAKEGKGILVKKAFASGHVCVSDLDDPVGASLDFVFAHPGVAGAVVGTINPKHLAENVAAAEKAVAKRLGD